MPIYPQCCQNGRCLTNPQGGRQACRQTIQRPERNGRMRILVVEDDLTIQKQLKTLLSGNGYEVDTVTDFSNVIEQVKSFAPICFC